MKISRNNLFPVVMLLFSTSLYLAAAPYDDWPSAPEYDSFIEDATWLNLALSERLYAADALSWLDYIVPPEEYAGSAAGTLYSFKFVARNILKLYLDTAEEFPDGTVVLGHLVDNYTDDMNSYICLPMMTNILESTGLPADYFENTPRRCISDSAQYGAAGLKRIVSEMSVTVEGCGQWTNQFQAHGFTYGGIDNWGEAVSAAEADVVLTGPFYGGAAYAYTFGYYNWTHDEYDAMTRRSFAELSGSASTNVPRRGMFFVYAEAPWAGEEFSGNGDVEEGWNYFSSAGPSKQEHISVRIGNPSLPVPEWCDAPSRNDSSNYKGYIINRAAMEHDRWILWAWDFAFVEPAE